ncbi:MAG: GTP 3',8-cyclase MoaA [Marinobacter sp.]|nr:GTP 3',8-cyclase MoaA [Marinobacter sp.]|tara:strand:- start:818 stop:1801 length:984 start_codon:yes stop_codon:yes gene_type:complete
MTQLVDQFGRKIKYLRLSVTDRCDFRCIYCMDETMRFLPRQQLLTVEEIVRLARIFIELGVEKIRLTGGEPLVRRGIQEIVSGIGALPGLKDFAMTTNGSGLLAHAVVLKERGLRRLNISLDSLQADRFASITRTGKLDTVLAGIRAARDAGFENIKLNTVVMNGRNTDEIVSLVDFARTEGIDISFIEEMPMGELTSHGRDKTFYSSSKVRSIISDQYSLIPTTETTLGPSHYFRMADSTTRVGFISPFSPGFCTACNRVRLTADGRLLLCLGNEDSLDLRSLLRANPDNPDRIRAAITQAVGRKPERHHFDGGVQVLRFMNMTGG